MTDTIGSNDHILDIENHDCELFRVARFARPDASGSYSTADAFLVRTVHPAENAFTAIALTGTTASVQQTHIYTRHGSGLGFCVVVFVSTSSRVPVEWSATFDPSLPPLWTTTPDAFVDSFGFTTTARSPTEWTVTGIDQTRFVVAGRPAVFGYSVPGSAIPREAMDTTFLTVRLAAEEAGDALSGMNLTVLSSCPFPIPWALVVDFATDYAEPIDYAPSFSRVDVERLGTSRWLLRGRPGADEYVDSSRAVMIPSAVVFDPRGRP